MTKTNLKLLDRVQLISDELDEIKIRLDTLHENLEQGAIDEIERRIGDILEQIRAKDVSNPQNFLFHDMIIMKKKYCELVEMK